MSCVLAVPGRVEALLAGALGPEDTAAIRAHLAEPCEVCLERLELVEGSQIVRALAGVSARLEAAEADLMFDSIQASLEVPPVVAITSRLTPRWKIVAGFVPVALAASLAIFFVRGPPASTERFKGEVATPSADLWAYRARVVDGRPIVDEAVQSGDRLSAGEYVLFRYQLQHPAFVYWLLEDAKGRELLIEPAGDGLITAAGEHELGAGDQALALDPRSHAPAFSVLLVACSAPMSTATLLDPEALAVGRCSVSTLDLRVGVAE